MRVLHAWHKAPWDGIKPQNFPIRIPSRSHGVRAEDQALDGHHLVESAAWPGDVVVSGRPVIVVAPRGVRMYFVETRIVLDAHHGAHGEGDRQGGGGRGWVGGGHGGFRWGGRPACRRRRVD